MVNRALLRIKAVQVLYSYFADPTKTLHTGETELHHSIDKSYDLYMQLLVLMLETTKYAARRIDAGKNKLRATQEEKNPNTRFIDNRFIKQLEENEELSEYLMTRQLSWSKNPEVIKDMYRRIINTEYYDEYMYYEESNYAGDREFWRKVMKRELLTNEVLGEALEDQSIYWNDDLHIVQSFILKTIKQYDETGDSTQSLQPKYGSESDEKFITRLFDTVILQSSEFEKMIEKHTKNWDVERIAVMDVLLLKIAIAEIIEFPSIPLRVTFNEYLDLAKVYSTPRSNAFINGVLDKIVADLKRENKIQKLEDLGAPKS